MILEGKSEQIREEEDSEQESESNSQTEDDDIPWRKQ